MTSRGGVALLFALSVPFIACKPKAGAPCVAADSRCTDEDAALLCIDGKLTAARCMGRGGCSPGDNGVACDIHDNAAGDVCLEAPGAPVMCAPDKKSRVECKANKIELTACDGPKGCFSQGAKETCDEKPHFREHDPCRILFDDACSDDGKAWLTCKGGVYTVAAICRGSTGCGYMGEAMTCDNTIGQVGDACRTGETCTADGKTLLDCTDGKLTAARICPGPNGCTKSDGAARLCDGAPGADAGAKKK